MKEKTQSDTEKKQEFDVLAVPCNRAFVVSLEKAEKFKTQKLDSGIRQQIEEATEKFRINNLVEEGPVLKKTKGFNRK